MKTRFKIPFGVGTIVYMFYHGKIKPVTIVNYRRDIATKVVFMQVTDSADINEEIDTIAIDTGVFSNYKEAEKYATGLKTKKTTLCEHCVNGYYAYTSLPDENGDEHEICGGGYCYLCQRKFGDLCDEFIPGRPPADKEAV